MLSENPSPTYMVVVLWPPYPWRWPGPRPLQVPNGLRGPMVVGKYGLREAWPEVRDRGTRPGDVHGAKARHCIRCRPGMGALISSWRDFRGVWVRDCGPIQRRKKNRSSVVAFVGVAVAVGGAVVRWPWLPCVTSTFGAIVGMPLLLWLPEEGRQRR